MNGRKESSRGKEYMSKRGAPEVVTYIDGSVGARMKM